MKRAMLLFSFLLMALFVASETSAMLHPTMGRFMQRDPMGYVDGMGLYESLGSNVVNRVDPYGLSNFDLKANAIKRYLELGQEGLAADAARDLFADMFIGGRAALEWFASSLMENWYYGAKKDPYVVAAGDVKGAMLDKAAAKGKTSPRDQLKAIACSWPNDPADSHGVVSQKSIPLSASQGDYYHALGKFSISFAGFYDCDDGECSFDGKWTLSDRYDWAPGTKFPILGVDIQADWALLVEKYHRAKPFDVSGTYDGDIVFDCPCNPQKGNSSGGGTK